MIPVKQSDLPALHFEGDENSRRIRVSADKIGWLHAVADQAGAKFDITIKDARGGIRFQRSGFGTELEKSGELINLPTMLGEEVEVVLENITGAKAIDIFLN